MRGLTFEKQNPEKRLGLLERVMLFTQNDREEESVAPVTLMISIVPKARSSPMCFRMAECLPNQPV